MMIWSKEETSENWETKTLCVLLLDTSSSMSGKKMEDLNKGLHRLYEDILDDDALSQRIEIAIISFDSTVHYIQEPTLVGNFTMPTLTAKGATNMVAGILKATELVEERKKYYRDKGITYKRPWIIMITDGYEGDADFIIDQVIKDQENKRYYFLPVAIDENDADLSKLDSLSIYNHLHFKELNNRSVFNALLYGIGESPIPYNNCKANQNVEELVQLDNPFDCFITAIESPNSDPRFNVEDENGQEKMLCVILVDHSIATTNTIMEINQTLQSFYNDIQKDDNASQRIELSLVSCNTTLGILQQPALAGNFTMPILKAEGESDLFEGIINSIGIVKKRRIHYWNQGISTKRPWIILISDGDIKAESVKKNLKQIVDIREGAHYYKQYFIQPIAISEKANIEFLETLATTKPILLKEARFLEFFRFLSISFGGNPTPASKNTTINVDDWLESPPYIV